MPAVLFAKKAILPSENANVLQSLNMAAAFTGAGAETTFYPGLAGEKGVDTATRIETIRSETGLEAEEIASWSFLNGSHKGLYGLSLRARFSFWYMSRRRGLIYARDIAEAVFFSRLRRMARVRHRFLFEMHEVLHIQHQRPHSRFDWQATKRRERDVFHSIDGLVAINEVLVEQAREQFGYRGPGLVEPSGFNPKLFFPLPLFCEESPWPRAGNAVRLVYVGSQREGKGVKELVRAMALLPRRFQLKIIGSGDKKYMADLKSSIREIPDWEERIKCTGPLAPNRIRDACLGSHISVLPRQETQGYFSPLKLNESLAMGLPLVATPLRVFAGHAKLLHFSTDGSPEALAAAITELAERPALAQARRIDGLAASKGATWKARASRILVFSLSLS